MQTEKRQLPHEGTGASSGHRVACDWSPPGTQLSDDGQDGTIPTVPTVQTKQLRSALAMSLHLLIKVGGARLHLASGLPLVRATRMPLLCNVSSSLCFCCSSSQSSLCCWFWYWYWCWSCWWCLCCMWLFLCLFVCFVLLLPWLLFSRHCSCDCTNWYCSYTYFGFCPCFGSRVFLQLLCV